VVLRRVQLVISGKNYDRRVIEKERFGSAHPFFELRSQYALEPGHVKSRGRFSGPTSYYAAQT
jgi:hypothetical protein